MAYAAHAAAALETAAVLDESRDRNATLSALLALGRRSQKSPHERRWRGALADAIPEIVGYDQAHVLLWDPGDALLARVASSVGSVDLAPRQTALRDSNLESRLRRDIDTDSSLRSRSRFLPS